MRVWVAYVFSLLWILGCSAETATWDSQANSTEGLQDTIGTGTEIDASVTISTEQVSFVVEPSFEGNDNDAVPQAGIVRLETNVTAEIEIVVSGGDEEWILERISDTALKVPILGLKPDTDYEVTIHATAGGETVTVGPLEWSTPDLPTNFPPIDVAVSTPDEMEPGMTMFNVWQGINGNLKRLIIVDHEGVVRWYYLGQPVYDDHRRLPNGNVLFTPDECVIWEVDMLGNRVRSWHAENHPGECDVPDDSIPVPVDAFHHEISMLPNGDLLSLSSERREIENFPTSEDDPDAERTTAQVIGSVIVEFTPEGEILKYIPLLDLLDPTRIGRGSLTASWSLIHKYRDGSGPPRDWDHSNAVIYEEASDAYYVSVRHQDAVLKINRTDEALVWILGTHANWESPWEEFLLEPVGQLEWPYHQHAVSLSSEGLGLYDNGNYRAAAYEERQTEYSRAVLYSVDEQAMTVEELWSYGASSGDDLIYSSAMGDADWLPITGNVLICNGFISTDNGHYPKIEEVTQDGTRLFELNVQPPDDNGDFAAHRALRIPDIRQ